MSGIKTSIFPPVVFTVLAGPVVVHDRMPVCGVYHKIFATFSNINNSHNSFQAMNRWSDSLNISMWISKLNLNGFRC